MNFLSFGFIMPWVMAQESNFTKYKISKFIKICDGIKFLNQMFIFQELYFFTIKNSQVGQKLLQSSRTNVETDFALSV